MNKQDLLHRKRVRQELLVAGITKYGLIKQESRFLPRIIHPEEHVMGVAYGRYKHGSGMLIATDRRVIFLDRKPLFTINDEIRFDVISGLSHDIGTGFASVTLHTKLGDYQLNYVNLHCADIFSNYIEKVCIERNIFIKSNRINADKAAVKVQIAPVSVVDRIVLDTDSFAFLRSHELGVISTVDRDGKLYGSAVYYVISDDPASALYIVTKSETQKTHNMFANHLAAFTVYDEKLMQTVQMQCRTELEADPKVKDSVFSSIVHTRRLNSKSSLPPVTKLKKGSYAVIKLLPTHFKFNDFSKD